MGREAKRGKENGRKEKKKTEKKGGACLDPLLPCPEEGGGRKEEGNQVWVA